MSNSSNKEKITEALKISENELNIPAPITVEGSITFVDFIHF